MDCDRLLSSLGLAMGLPNLGFGDGTCARLLVDGKLEVNFEKDDAAGTLQLYAVLCPVPAEGREALYRRLLEANLFGAQTQGASFAIDGPHGEIVLYRTVHAAEVNADAFAKIVEGFVAAAEQWQRQFAPGAPAQETPTQPRSALPAFMEFLRG